jgi:hypothetical protein
LGIVRRWDYGGRTGGLGLLDFGTCHLEQKWLRMLLLMQL